MIEASRELEFAAITGSIKIQVGLTLLPTTRGLIYPALPTAVVFVQMDRDISVFSNELVHAPTCLLQTKITLGLKLKYCNI